LSPGPAGRLAGPKEAGLGGLRSSRARVAHEQADYRWAVQLLDHLVTAEPNNTEAKNLQADAYEQLGYQAEGPQWRYAFLTAALDLREGTKKASRRLSQVSTS
jgi:alkyl sulfatase BDS1-like metallo-beta-lactamase superfamily hydrolase